MRLVKFMQGHASSIRPGCFRTKDGTSRWSNESASPMIGEEETTSERDPGVGRQTHNACYRIQPCQARDGE